MKRAPRALHPDARAAGQPWAIAAVALAIVLAAAIAALAWTASRAGADRLDEITAADRDHRVGVIVRTADDAAAGIAAVVSSAAWKSAGSGLERAMRRLAADGLEIDAIAESIDRIDDQQAGATAAADYRWAINELRSVLAPLLAHDAIESVGVLSRADGRVLYRSGDPAAPSPRIGDTVPAVPRALADTSQADGVRVAAIPTFDTVGAPVTIVAAEANGGPLVLAARVALARAASETGTRITLVDPAGRMRAWQSGRGAPISERAVRLVAAVNAVNGGRGGGGGAAQDALGSVPAAANAAVATVRIAGMPLTIVVEPGERAGPAATPWRGFAGSTAVLVALTALMLGWLRRRLRVVGHQGGPAEERAAMAASGDETPGAISERRTDTVEADGLRTDTGDADERRTESRDAADLDRSEPVGAVRNERDGTEPVPGAADVDPRAFARTVDDDDAAESSSDGRPPALDDSVVAIMQAVGRIASTRDLTIRVPATDDVTGAISDALNLLTEETARAFREVASVAGDVARATIAVRGQGQRAADAARSEQREVDLAAQELAAAARALTGVAELAQRVDDSARLAVDAHDAAALSVERTGGGVARTRALIGDTERQIKRLGERSQEIGQVVALIRSISDRTGILALNASIRAVSSRDEGRGFGAVADEVKRLSGTTRDSAERIAHLVAAIQTDTAETIAAMSEAIAQVVEVTRLSEDAAKQVAASRDRTRRLAGDVRSIARTTERQARASAALQDRADRIRGSSAQTSRELEAQAGETQRLAESARRLLAAVSAFKVDR